MEKIKRQFLHIRQQSLNSSAKHPMFTKTSLTSRLHSVYYLLLSYHYLTAKVPSNKIVYKLYTIIYNAGSRPGRLFYFHKKKHFPEYLITFLLPLSSTELSVGVLLSEASVVLSDDITSPSGPVELLRLTLTKLLLSLTPAPSLLAPELVEDGGGGANKDEHVPVWPVDASLLELYCSGLQIDNQLYNRASFHFPVLLCQDQRGGAEPSGPWSLEANPARSPEALDEFKRSCFLQLRVTMAADRCTVDEVGLLLPADCVKVVREVPKWTRHLFF